MNKRFVAVLVLTLIVATAVLYQRLASFPAGRRPSGFPQIRSWNGTTLKVDWDGLRYQATCKSSTGSIEGGGPVTYPACELPPKMGVWWGRGGAWNDQTWAWNDETLSLRWRAKEAGGQWVGRQEDFVITSVKAIGPAISPLP